MATPAEIQAQLDSAGTGRVANILVSSHADGTYDNHYVQGMSGYAGRARWCQTTAANSAAVQAAAILATLAA